MSSASIPSLDGLLHPILEVLSDGAPREISQIVDAVADRIGLDVAARDARLASGERVVENRVWWARTMLFKAGMVDQPKASTVVITDAGRAALETVQDRITTDYLRKASPGYRNWLADMGGELPSDETTPSGEATVWMVRAGREGRYAAEFVQHGAAIVGWGITGDVTGLSRDEIAERIAACYPDDTKTRRGQATNTLFRFARVLNHGDLVVTPEPASRTILFGRVTGPYHFLPEPIDAAYQHARTVSWFARVDRDELSYGARNSLGTLITLSRPGHERELLRLGEAHAGDQAPEPVRARRRASGTPSVVPKRVGIPASATVRPRPRIGDFQTVPRRLLPLLDDLDSGDLALPDFQRTFVWAPDATRELIVSMIRSFPAGALLFLQGGSSTFKARSVEEAPPLAIQPSHLVLDGQQRLTSLYQAIFGVGSSRFFLDVGALVLGSDVDEAVRVLPTNRAERLSSLEAQADALLMPLSAVRNGGAARWRDDVVEARNDEDQAHVRGLLRDVELAYIEPLVQYAFPVTILPSSTELEAVCTIFETLNRTGKPLTPFELISARAFAGGHSLRDLWLTARARHPILADFDLEPYYILQVIGLRLGLSCKRSSVLGLPPDDIAREWDDAVADMASALGLLRDECGVLVAKWLPYRPMLIPLSAAWREVSNAIGPAQGAMRAKLKRWFWCTCFTGEYDSASVTLAERDTPSLRSWLAGGDEPPVVRDFAWDPEHWRSVTSRQQGLYRATIALALTEHPRDFHTGVPLSRELIESNRIDDHHIFPRAYLRDIGKGSENDSVLNHCLIDSETNLRIGKHPPSYYLGEIRAALGSDLDDVLSSHRLPTGEQSPLEEDDFDGFLSWRIEQLSDALAERTGGLGTVVSELEPRRAKLNAQLEALELSLRQFIMHVIGDHAELWPDHVMQKAKERMATQAKKFPRASGGDDVSFASQLQFLDLRELQDIIVSKPAWPAFEPAFATKEAVSARFAQIAELRNVIRHSRNLSDVVVKDGEAGILWFRDALSSSA